METWKLRSERGLFMSKINAFLQKRKMNESRHGLRMIVISYSLSFVLLFFGSDALYNIRTGAKDTKRNSQDIDILAANKDVDKYSYQKAQAAQMSFMNSYLFNKDITSMDIVQEHEATQTNEAYWLLGYSMDEEEYTELIYQIDNSSYFPTEDQDIDTDTNQVSSFSVDTSAEYNANYNNQGKSGEKNKSEGIDQSEEKDKAEGKDQSEEKDKTESKLQSEEKDKAESKDQSESKYKSKDKSNDDNKQEAKVVMSLSAEDINILERIVQAEAGGEDMKGKILIANVIFNRIKDDEFPDTIKDVVYQSVGGKYQFSPVANKKFSKTKVSDNTEEAVKRALEGEDYSEGALYFMARKKSRKKSSTWFDNNLDRLFKHGGHEFFK